MSEEHFTVAYDGPALATHRMRVADLAPALIALSDAIRSAQAVLIPSEPAVTLDIKAAPREGSFVLDLILNDGPTFYERIVDLFSSKDADAAANLGEFIGWVVGAGLLIKQLFGKKVRSERTEAGITTITLDDGTTITTEAESVALYRSITFRQSMRKVVAPLDLEGVDTLDITSSRESLRVTAEDVVAFEVPEVVDEEVLDSEREVNLHLVNVAFEHGKWRVSDGSTTFFAGIADEAFVDRVRRNEIVFASGDRLRVMLRHRQFQTMDGLRSEYTVLEVIEHVPGGRQLPLDFDGEGDS